MDATPQAGAERSRRSALGALVISLLVGAVARQSSAALFTLTDANSVAQFDTATANNHFNWFVDGTDYLAQQAFWYRVGAVGPESSVHTLPIGVQGTSDINFDGNPDTLFVRYNAATFNVETRYTLTGGAPGSGGSDMAEQITITNLLDSPLEFHFFQYADFDLSAADSVVFTNANTVLQTGGVTHLSETVVTPSPSHREAAFFPVTLNELNDAAATTLSDTPPIGTALGPGDVTWAYQWDFVIPASGSVQISKDKNIGNSVPEPAATSLLGLIAGISVIRRKK